MKKLFSFFLLVFPAVIFAQQIDVQHYKFEVELSDAADAINAKATTTVKFLADASQLQFDLIGLEEEKGMKVFMVKEGNAVLQSFQDLDKLVISLKTNAKKNEIRTFEISYIGTPKDGLIISKNKFGERTFFSDHWPNRARNWLPVNDVPGDKASFEFIITAPAKYRVISNGMLVEEKKLGGNKKLTHWKQTDPISTKIMAMGAARFAVKSFNENSKGIPVSAWAYPQDSAKLFYDYAVAPSILQFFIHYIAPFPYSKLANVQSTTMFGGMENAGAIFYSEELVSGQRKSEAIVAHEIAHQWFGDEASEKSFAHLWLSEGFATYLTNYYFEKTYGKDTAYKRMQNEKQKIIGFLKERNSAVVDSTTDLMSLLNANSYEKGGWVLHMLRQEVGDSAFRKILQTYYHQYKGSNADTRDFEAIVEKVSGQELTWFFDQWLYRPGIPVLKMETGTSKNEFILKVKQEGPVYQFPIEVQLTSDDGTTTTKKFLVKDEKHEFKMPIKTNGADYSEWHLKIDPDGKLLYRLKE